MSKQRLGQSAHQILGLSPDTDKATDQRVVSRDARDDQSFGERSTGIGQLLGSLAITLISVGMLLGSFLLSQLDASGVRPPATSVAQISPSPILPLSTALPPIPSPTEAISSPSPATETATPPIPTLSPTLPSPLIPPSCSPPSDWVAYTVQQGETLYSLGWRTGVTALALMQANCLSAPTIYPGQQIYLPPTLHASPTPWPFPCGPPLGWVAWYTVQPGDTVFSLSRRFGVSMEDIRRANCLSGYTIYVGTLLYLPPPTPTPVHTPTLPPTPTHTPTGTSTPTFTWTPTPTEFASVTPSLTPTATATLTSTVTHTSTPTPTPIDSPTPTSTPTPTPTGSPAPTYTPTPTPTELSTPTPTPTPSPTPTPTLFPTSTPTEPPISTPTPTATPTPSGG